MSPNKILHVITGTEVGGAEITLLKVCQGLGDFEHVVISLTGIGKLDAEFARNGIKVISMDLRNWLQVTMTPWKFLRVLREEEPFLVQGWMYHGDLIASLTALLRPQLPIIWNLRHSELSRFDRLPTRIIRRVLAAMSGFVPTKIVANALEVVSVHKRLGYNASKFEVIHNGYDVERLVPSQAVRRVVRRALGLKDGEAAIGFVGKDSAGKGLYDLISAFSGVLEGFPSARLVLVGKNLSVANISLDEYLTEKGIRSSVIMIGETHDPLRIYQALDLLVSPSHSEGFPNVVAEAAAAGLLVVATDVGGSRNIISMPSFLVPPRNPVALQEKIISSLKLSKSSKAIVRRHNSAVIRTHYPETAMIQAYRRLYGNFLSD